jgi:nicotinamide-nucleotide adenylyltransferase
MASTHSIYKSLPGHISTALKEFRSSSSTFRLLQTVHPKNLTPEPATPPTTPPQTLLILDSSFNPPSIAHQTLALTALHKTSKSISQSPGPHRLLLLFSTMNADKAPSAASFDQRLTLMTIFAADLLRNLQTRPDAADYTAVPIDIGVTTAPYYSDKSAAINSSPEGKHWYPSSPQHIHLLGFDTLTRFFAPKYYQSFSPPLSALTPYFDAGHGLRATLRPDDAYGSEAEQRAFMQKLADGEMEADGGKKEWAAKVELVDPTPQAGVSSTVIRKAAKAGEWDVVGELCTEGVAEWVREEGLYEDDDRGAKMA